MTPTLVLAGTALSFALPGVREDVESVSIWNPGVHGLSEVLYAFTSAANNNGSAFAGLTANTPWLNTALGVAMLLGRFVPIVLVLALAGSLAKQDVVPTTAGTLPTYTPAVRRTARAASRSSSPHSPTSPYSRWVPWRKGSSDHVHSNSHPRSRPGASRVRAPQAAHAPVQLGAARPGAPRSAAQAQPGSALAQPRHVPRVGRRRPDHCDRDRRAVHRRRRANRAAPRSRSASRRASPSGSGSPCCSRTSPSRSPKGAARRRLRACARPARARSRTGSTPTTGRRMPQPSARRRPTSPRPT